MASIELDPASGFYRLVFRYGGMRFKRSLKVREEATAQAICGRVEETLSDLRRGRLVMPPDADPGTFILSDGKLDQKPAVLTCAAPPSATIGSLVELYRTELPQGAKEANSLRTERIHLAHIERILGGVTPLGSVDLAAAQRYAKVRGKQTHGKKVRRPIRPYTIRKELKSFRHVWTWCQSRGMVLLGPGWDLSDITMPRDREPEPFRTMTEIRERLARGGLSAADQKHLWDGLYLTGSELAELMAHLQEVRLDGFVQPMFAFAVYTGARRSEMLRSHIDDFDFRNGRVQIREKKRVKGKSSTRWVDLHPDLAGIMRRWFAAHPGGQYTLAQPDGSPLDVDLMDRRFDAAVRGTKFEVMRGWHVLRHSFASVLASKGVDQRIINSFMGHSTAEMARRYQHLLPATTKSAILLLMS